MKRIRPLPDIREFRDQRRRLIPVPAENHRDGTLRREGACDPPANAFRAAGDDCDFVLKLEIHDG
jgi:hypothetical protein